MKKFKFSLDAKFGQARAGIINTAHGSIKTPVFMPVGTVGSVKAVFPRDLLKINIEVILANTYHLMLRPGEQLIQEVGGLQNFMNWRKPILTDSGGFQIWSLAKLREINENGIDFSSHIDGKKYNLTPESSIKIQEKLNSTISMVLDECTEHPATFKRTRDSMELSIRWAERSKKKFKVRKGYGLFGIIQGGMYEELRILCSKELKNLEFDGYAIGGLSVGENHNKMINIVECTVDYLQDDKPRYLMGVGRPIDIIKSVERGIDMFDCVLPTRFGRNGRAFTSLGEINLRNSKYKYDLKPLDENVDCYASNNFSKSYIHHLTKSNEILSSMIISLHNIAFYKKMMEELRDSIINKTFNTTKEKYLEYHEHYQKT